MTVTPSPLRISVVVPTYNRSRWIRPAIETIRAQRYPVSEIVIVDDGSTDETEQVTAGLDGSVRVIRQPHAGVSAARNRGVEESTGDWVAFLDSDDAWHPAKLAVQAAAVASIPATRWCAAAGNAIDEQGRVLPDGAGMAGVFPLFRDLGVEPASFLRRWLADVTVTHEQSRIAGLFGDAFESLFTLNYVHASSALFHRDAFLASGGFDRSLHVAEDTEFFHRFSAQHPLLLLLEPLFGYRIAHGAALSNASSVVPRIVNALTSIDRALAARGTPSASEIAASRVARVRLLRRQAYARLTELAPQDARALLRSAMASGGAWDLHALSLLTASYFPVSFLRGLHALKRAMRRQGVG